MAQLWCFLILQKYSTPPNKQEGERKLDCVQSWCTHDQASASDTHEAVLHNPSAPQSRKGLDSPPEPTSFTDSRNRLRSFSFKPAFGHPLFSSSAFVPTPASDHVLVLKTSRSPASHLYEDHILRLGHRQLQLQGSHHLKRRRLNRPESAASSGCLSPRSVRSASLPVTPEMIWTLSDSLLHQKEKAQAQLGKHRRKARFLRL